MTETMTEMVRCVAAALRDADHEKELARPKCIDCRGHWSAPLYGHDPRSHGPAQPPRPTEAHFRFALIAVDVLIGASA